MRDAKLRCPTLFVIFVNKNESKKEGNIKLIDGSDLGVITVFGHRSVAVAVDSRVGVIPTPNVVDDLCPDRSFSQA